MTSPAAELDGYLNEIDLIEALVVPRSLDIQNGNDILVVEIAQQLHFTQSPQTEHRVVKGNDLLDRNFLARRLVNRGAEEGGTG